MTTVARFSRQNDAGLRALNVVLCENLVLVVVLVLESKALYYVSCMGLEGLDQTTNAQIALVASMLKKLYVLRLATSAIRLMSTLYRA